MPTIDEIATFAKKKGFVFPSAEIYGGMAGFYDYGPLGSEMVMKIKNLWWKSIVHDRENVVGINGSIIGSEAVWNASGHVANFIDVVAFCKKCKLKIKVDKHEIGKAKCDCGALYENLGEFNPMFSTEVGVIKSEAVKAYLRPETAQTIFINFKNVLDTSRVKLPFGIAQIGKAFRNEISPRNFLFRMREFEQMELEFFTHPDKKNDCPIFEEVEKVKVNVLTAKEQAGTGKMESMTMGDLLKKKIIKTKWHAYWIGYRYNWYLDLGVNPEKLRLREHVPEELSHYSAATWDIDYEYPIGWKELEGNADRTDYDLQQHTKSSKVDLSYYDEDTKERVIPHVVSEPSAGVDRVFLTLLMDAYHEEEVKGETRIVLKLHPDVAPFKVAILPLVKKDGLSEKGKEVFNNLKQKFNSFYDESGSIGRRYRRMDEIGTPFCITVDHESLEQDDCTLRERDSMRQIRIKIKDLSDIIKKLSEGEKLETFGKFIN
ncbi:MAG: glycine--tRNA ligase [Nanoarchaeota archaeon]|nr:glycine--tRNA ligase [Nanoarchaeota archaeon]MBU4124302.1 glycine--tRNA ligase [Nanoarchaeota archaeon]